MNTEITVAVLSLLGTAIGSIAGILAANKLTNYRIEQLEKKVEKHNNLVVRMTAAEQSIGSAHHRIDDINTYLVAKTKGGFSPYNNENFNNMKG